MQAGSSSAAVYHVSICQPTAFNVGPTVALGIHQRLALSKQLLLHCTWWFPAAACAQTDLPPLDPGSSWVCVEGNTLNEAGFVRHGAHCDAYVSGWLKLVRAPLGLERGCWAVLHHTDTCMNHLSSIFTH